jgi:hypothetical protein
MLSRPDLMLAHHIRAAKAGPLHYDLLMLLRPENPGRPLCRIARILLTEAAYESGLFPRIPPWLPGGLPGYGPHESSRSHPSSVTGIFGPDKYFTSIEARLPLIVV